MERNHPIKRPRKGKVILIPTDFSPVCENAVNHGFNLARHLGYNLCILHVISGVPDSKEKRIALTRTGLEKHFAKYRMMADGIPGVKIEIMLREGSLLRVINKVAREVKAGIIIIGTHGKKGIQNLFGSNALRVVLDAPCPVLVIQGRPFSHGYKKLVVPVSGDIYPGPAIQWVSAMNKAFGSQVFLFQSCEADASGRDHLRNNLMRITSELDSVKIAFQIEIAGTGNDFTAEVVRFADLQHCDLIMGVTMPVDEILGFNFSSWNEQLMFNGSQIPVLCINPDE